MKKIPDWNEVRIIPNHPCELPFKDEPVNYKIADGIFILCRRRFWKWMTISVKSPDAKRYLKSAAKVNEEELRHLNHHPYMIHPFSQSRFAWEMFMVLIWSSLFVLIPLTIASYDFAKVIKWITLGMDLACLADIILWFITGYYDKSYQITVMRFKVVAKRYVSTYFFFDVISSQPISLYISLLHKEDLHYLTSIRLLKVVRLPTLIDYIQKFSQRANWCTSDIKFICFTLWLVVISTWITSAAFMWKQAIHPENYYAISGSQISQVPMLLTAFAVARALMAVGVTIFANTDALLTLLQITTLIVGSIFEIIILAKVKQVYEKRASSRNKYNKLLEEMGEYMKYKELPTRLKNKILKYVDFKFQKHIFREEDVLSTLSPKLKHDILLQRCQRIVEKVDFFKDLPQEVMLRIATKLRTEIFLPSDVIVLAGYAGHAMYFIYMGTVAVYTVNGKEICHLDDGSHFGEIALVINEPRVATVIAVKECQLFRLSRKDFQEAIEPFPELNKKIRNLAMNRLKTTLQMMSESKEERNTLEVDDEEV